MKVLNYDKVRKVEGHECSLPQDEELINLYINGGIFVDLRRKLRQFLMVSAANYETKSVLKSSAQIRSEESRHLRNYYCMIHPFSEGRVTWEKIMIIIYFGHLMLMPMMMALPTTRPLIAQAKYVCDVFSYIDIVLFFFTGYHNLDTRKIVMSPWKVCKHYVSTYFIFDFVSILPYVTYMEKTNQVEELQKLKFLYVLRLVRLPTMINYIKKFCQRLDLWSYKLTTINFMLCLIIVIWWGTAATFIAFSGIRHYDLKYFHDNPDVFTPMLDCCFQVVRSMMLVAISSIQGEDSVPMILNIVLLCIGSILNIIILSQVIQVYRRHSNSKNKYNNLIQEIGEYMTYKELPTPLRNRVLRYVEFKFQKNIFKEGDILLSKILKQDVVLHNCKRMVERVDFFKGLPNTLILRIVTKLRSEIYLPNDVIVQAGVPGNAMYFIYMGTVAVYTITEKEICHLEDGSHFGEISLVINEPRVASVIAVTDCEVFRLSRKDFLEAIEPYPSLCNRIKNSALSRLKNTRKAMERMETVDIQAVESKLSDVTVTAIPMTPKAQPPGQSKYAQLLGVIEEMGREVRPTYAGSRSSAERLKRGIVHARILVRECLIETERSARQ